MEQYKLGPVTLSCKITSIADEFLEMLGVPVAPLAESSFRALAYFTFKPKPITLSEWFLRNDHSRRAMRWRKIRQVRKVAHAR